jgi:putative SOS response-associated peptidase YedK
MCGRYTIIAKAEVIEKKFDVEVPKSYTPSYNAAPTQKLPVITNENPSRLSFFQWGLVPSWSKDERVGSKLINARAESVIEKASFKNAFKQQRCLVPSDGFYEWKRYSKKSKIPYRIHLRSKELFSFAGLWEEYVNEDQNLIQTFTIITKEANPAISKIHTRMPVILDPESERKWLSSSVSSEEHLSLLNQNNDQEFEYFTVSSLVNSVSNNNPQLIVPALPTDQFGNMTLFN